MWVSPHSGCQMFRIGSVTSHESSQFHQDANPALLLATQKVAFNRSLLSEAKSEDLDLVNQFNIVYTMTKECISLASFPWEPITNLPENMIAEWQRGLQDCWRSAQRWLTSISATITSTLSGEEGFELRGVVKRLAFFWRRRGRRRRRCRYSRGGGGLCPFV